MTQAHTRNQLADNRVWQCLGSLETRKQRAVNSETAGGMENLEGVALSKLALGGRRRKATFGTENNSLASWSRVPGGSQSCKGL